MVTCREVFATRLRPPTTPVIPTWRFVNQVFETLFSVSSVQVSWHWSHPNQDLHCVHLASKARYYLIFVRYTLKGTIPKHRIQTKHLLSFEQEHEAEYRFEPRWWYQTSRGHQGGPLFRYCSLIITRSVFTSTASCASNSWTIVLRCMLAWRTQTMLAAMFQYRHANQKTPDRQYGQRSHQTRQDPCRGRNAPFRCRSSFYDLPGCICGMPSSCQIPCNL